MFEDHAFEEGFDDALFFFREAGDGLELQLKIVRGARCVSSNKGKLIKVTNGTGTDRSTTEYTGFDILGRVTASKQTTDGQTYTTGYAYNLSGALTEETYPSGRVVKNVLDTNGDLSIVQSGKCLDAVPGTTAACTNRAGFWNYADSFTYNASGAVTSMQLGNGRWETTVFNSRLQPTQIALRQTQGATNLLKLDYSYGTTANNGNVQSQTITVPGLANPFVQNYQYDPLNRLKSATETQNNQQTWKQTYTFDRYGNRRFDAANTTTIPQGCPETVCNPQIDAATNKLIGYQFDTSGNTKQDAENRKFTYDGENKQVKVETVDQGGNPISTTGEYFYDGDGRRIKKIVPSTGETTVFVYDASAKLVAEYSTVVTPAQDAKVSYLTNDHLGSPRITTDQNGQTISRRDYMPYGEEIISLGGRSSTDKYVADDVRQGFTGYINDEETGLDFAQARMYAKGIGRFTGSDPGPFDPLNPQVMNRYIYTINNPLKYMDSDGRKIKLTGSAEEIEKARIYLQNTSGIKLEVDKKGNVKVVGTIESKTASKDFADELKTILDDKKTATFNIVSENEEILVDDGGAASDKNRPQNIDINDINQIANAAPELGAALTTHALREGLELAKGNKYNAESQMLTNGKIREISPSAHDIALKSENRVMSGISGTTQERGRAPINADQKYAEYEFKYTTVTYTVTAVESKSQKDALTVRKKTQ